MGQSQIANRGLPAHCLCRQQPCLLPALRRRADGCGCRILPWWFLASWLPPLPSSGLAPLCRRPMSSDTRVWHSSRNTSPPSCGVSVLPHLRRHFPSSAFWPAPWGPYYSCCLRFWAPAGTLWAAHKFRNHHLTRRNPLEHQRPFAPPMASNKQNRRPPPYSRRV